MRNEKSLNVLTQEQKSKYLKEGYLGLSGLVSQRWLDRLRVVTDSFVEESKALTKSDKRFDLEPSHTAEEPRIRRLNSPVDFHEEYWEFASEGPFADIAEDLLGPNFKFHHSKLNFKWSGGGEEVKWHQDIQFWPHTDFSPLTIGVYLDDVDAEMGPMGVLPGSHHGQLYNLYREDGSWGGAMNDSDIASLDLDDMRWLDGPAGSVTVHNCCLVHGSVANSSTRPRPLLLQTYSRADSYPILGIGANGVTGKRSGAVIAGNAQQSVTIDGRVIPGAPDWSQRGAPTIFGSQNNK